MYDDEILRKTLTDQDEPRGPFPRWALAMYCIVAAVAVGLIWWGLRA